MPDRERMEVESRVDEDADLPVEFHRPTGTYRTEFDYERRLPSEAVVVAIAHVRERDPGDLPPLYATVDPEALDSVFLPALYRRPASDSSVTFEYVGHRVTVNSHGTVEVAPIEGGRSV